MSKKDKVQDMKINQLKFEVQDTFKKGGKITTDFEPINKEDVLNKAYLDETLFKKRPLIIIRKRVQRI